MTAIQDPVRQETQNLTLCDVLRLTAGLTKDELNVHTYRSLLERLDLPESLIDEHIFFTDESYARNLICVTPRFEMIVMCWKPGQISSIHDHLDSFAVIKVLRGTLTNINFQRTDQEGLPLGKTETEGRAVLEVANEELLPAGSLLGLDCGVIHQMGNRVEAGEPLVTLHCYARPLREINTYFPDDERYERKRLVYSLLHF